MFPMVKRLAPLAAVVAAVGLAGCVEPQATMGANQLPPMRWDHRPEAREWTLTTLAALKDDGAALAETVPADIDEFCPGYEAASPAERRAFWAGLFSTIAKYESTWNPAARGGGGRWIGLMQIAPPTAGQYNCEAQSREELKDGSANLSCAVRIAAHQVARDGAIVSDGSGSWRGVARDWAPMRSSAKRTEMAAWTSQQSYCQKG